MIRWGYAIEGERERERLGVTYSLLQPLLEEGRVTAGRPESLRGRRVFGLQLLLLCLLRVVRVHGLGSVCGGCSGRWHALFSAHYSEWGHKRQQLSELNTFRKMKPEGKGLEQSGRVAVAGVIETKRQSADDEGESGDNGRPKTNAKF